MSLSRRRQLDALCAHLAKRRPAILRAWREAAEADPKQQTARALTRGQFIDHIPEVLDAFELKLRSRPGGVVAAGADRDKKKEEVKHGLHRWQQGYRLAELMSEWGHLQLCLFDEFEAFAARHPRFARANLGAVTRQMISLVNEAIAESAAQYERMERAEAASHLGELDEALDRVKEIERSRAALIHQSVHDLSNNVFGVQMAASLLGSATIAEPRREEFATLLDQGVTSVTAMLGDLMELARLEAGQETRELTPFDGATLVAGLCAFNQPAARARGLRLTTLGPPELPVEGDPGKVRRLLQNLVGNAIKYTSHGGVTVSWGLEKQNWWLKVSDTGPGLQSDASAPLVAGLKEATASAREADVKIAATTGEISQVLAPAAGAREAPGPPKTQAGEGIGLSIVKRLCELLDASLEVASAATGSIFRVVLPRHYQTGPAPVRKRPPP
jgi:signal transduction histidine kinase